MKNWSYLILCLFILFLVTPSLVAVNKHNIDISFFFNTVEEEEASYTLDEVKFVPILTELPLHVIVPILKKAIQPFYCHFKIKTTNFKILSPPPELDYRLTFSS